MTKISVIVPAYITDDQGKKYLKECLDSIRDQTFKDYEVIIVDDSSPVDFTDLIDKFKYYRLSKNSGIGATRQKGVELATGEYIAFLSHDDKWDPTFLELMLNFASKNPDCGIYTNYYSIDNQGNVISQFKAPHFNSKEEFIIACQSWSDRNDCFIMWSGILFPKKFFDEIPIDKTLRIGEDLKFILMTCKLFKFKYLDAWLTFYRRHPQQATLNMLREIPENNAKIREDVKKWYQKI